LIYTGVDVPDEMARKSKQVLVRLTPERKQDWDEEAEARGQSLSEFVRHTVDDRVEGRHEGTTDSIDAEAITEAVEAAIENHTEEVDSRLSSVEAAVNGLQEELDGSGKGTVAAELIFEELPNFSPYTKDDDGQPVTRPDEEVADEAKSPEELAGDIGVPVGPVRRTIEKLDVESERIYSIEMDNGQRRYFSDV
jgi:hypothetical protein